MGSDELIIKQQRSIIKDLESKNRELEEYVESLENVLSERTDDDCGEGCVESIALFERTESFINLIHWLNINYPNVKYMFHGKDPILFTITPDIGAVTITGVGVTPLHAFIETCSKFIIHYGMSKKRKKEHNEYEDYGEGDFTS